MGCKVDFSLRWQPDFQIIINIILAHLTTTTTIIITTMTVIVMFTSGVHPTTITTMAMAKKWLFLAIMTTFGSAALPDRITIMTTMDTTRKWLFLETMITFGLTALLTDFVTLKMGGSLFPVTMITFIFSGQCSLQENKVVRS
jgi:hypothetical protein